MNAFAFAALSDGAAIASALGFEADAALFGAAAAALRAAIVARAFNESAGAFNAAVLADSAAFPDLFWAGPPSAAALAPNALANYVALAKGVLDNDAPRAARAVQFIMAGDSGGVVAAAGAPMTSIQLLAALYGYGAPALRVACRSRRPRRARREGAAMARRPAAARPRRDGVARGAAERARGGLLIWRTRRVRLLVGSLAKRTCTHNCHRFLRASS